LFEAELDVPITPQVERARARDQGQWERLGQAVQIYQEQGLDAAEALLRDSVDWGVREQVLLQDLRSLEWGAERLLSHYQVRYEAERDAVSTLLFARLIEEPSRRAKLLDEAKRRDPKLLQVRVELLALEPFQVGDDMVLRRLLGLLDRDPGLAEGWRLLRELAPRYGRADLACAAADWEPWCPWVDPHVARLDQVRTCLSASRPAAALHKLDEYQLLGLEAVMLRASALAELERAPEAWRLLIEAEVEFGADAMLVFNLGLLARDYLLDEDRARYEFERFLLIAAAEEAAGRTVPMRRVLMAQTWLRQLQAELEPPVGQAEAEESQA